MIWIPGFCCCIQCTKNALKWTKFKDYGYAFVALANLRYINALNNNNNNNIRRCWFQLVPVFFMQAETRLLLLTRLALETRLVLELQFWSLLSVYWSQEVSPYQHTLVVVISGLSTDISCLFSVRGHKWRPNLCCSKNLSLEQLHCQTPWSRDFT